VARTIDAGELRASAARACGTRVASAVDVSDAMVVLELEGAGARPLLARGTGIDLSRERFAPGQCARTRLAQLAVLLRPRTDDVIELIVDRGPSAWLCEWLADAAAGLGGDGPAPLTATAAR
jgi:heterotetrameric sarcosine oxidase gamma subunit